MSWTTWEEVVAAVQDLQRRVAELEAHEPKPDPLEARHRIIAKRTLRQIRERNEAET
jgi:hypothetical protein